METSIKNKCKTFTSLEQSKALAKILPIESADMVYIATADDEIGDTLYTTEFKSEIILSKDDDDYIQCWSLAALLGALPFHLIVNNQGYAFSMHKGLNKDGETYVFRYNVFNTDVCLCETDYYNNPVDACVEMILKLNEQKLL